MVNLRHLDNFGCFRTIFSPFWTLNFNFGHPVLGLKKCRNIGNYMLFSFPRIPKLNCKKNVAMLSQIKCSIFFWMNFLSIFFQNGVAAVLHLLHFEMKKTHFKVIEKTFKPSQTANHHRVYFINLIGKYSKQK